MATQPTIINPVMEWDARQETEANLATVDPWNDQSGEGNDASPVNTPQMLVTGWDAVTRAVRLEQTERFTYDDDAFQGNPFTVFAVFRATSLGGSPGGLAILGRSEGAAPPRPVSLFVQPNGAIAFNLGSGASGILSASGVIVVGNDYVVTIRLSTVTGMILRVNGVEVAEDDSKIATTEISPNAVIGFANSDFTDFEGEDKLIVWISGHAVAASDKDILAMECFLSEAFNVAVVGPCPQSLPETPKPMRVSDLWSAGALRDKSPSGLIQTRNTKAAGWMFTMTWPLLSVRNFDHQELTTFLYTAWQRGQIFNAKHPLQPGSGLRPNGLGTATVAIKGGGQAIGSDSIITDGWPVSTANVARAGDAIKIDADSGVYILTETAFSDGTGEVELFITPPLRKVPADDAVVQTTDIPFRVTISDRSRLEKSRHPQSASGPAITLLEALD